MQDPKSSQTSRKTNWYQRAINMATLWKSTTTRNGSAIWKTIFKINDSSNIITSSTTNNITNSTNKKLRKCTSMRVATSFTRVCLCAPISSYTEVFQADHHMNMPPRRSYTYPARSNNNNNNNHLPSRSSSSRGHHGQQALVRTRSSSTHYPSARMSFEERKIFRGKSLTDDVLMRRFVVEEEAMMQVRRIRNEMEIIRRRSALKKRKIGPSPLSRTTLPEEACC